MKKRVQILLASIGLLALLLAACQPSAGGNSGTSATQALPQTGETAAPAATTAVTQAPAATEMVATTSAPAMTEAPATTEAPSATQAATTAPGASTATCNLTADQEQQLVSAGENLYTTTCAGCHGPQGEGQGSFPTLANNPEVIAQDPAGMLAKFMNPQVHPFITQLTPEQIASVVSYVRSSFGNQASTVCPELISTTTP